MLIDSFHVQLNNLTEILIIFHILKTSCKDKSSISKGKGRRRMWVNSFLSEQKFQLVMQEHTDYLLKIAYLYVKDWPAAEDIIQDVFLAYYQKFEQFEERSTLRTYLARMTINKLPMKAFRMCSY